MTPEQTAIALAKQPIPRGKLLTTARRIIDAAQAHVAAMRAARLAAKPTRKLERPWWGEGAYR